jgi:hypothetical protein
MQQTIIQVFSERSPHTTKIGVTWGIPRETILDMKITIITEPHEVLAWLLQREDDIGNKEVLASLRKAVHLKYAPVKDWGSYITMSKHTDYCLCGSPSMLLWWFPTHHTLTSSHCVILTTFDRRRTSWRIVTSRMQWKCKCLQDCIADHVWWLPDMFWTIVWILSWSCWRTAFCRQLHLRDLSTTNCRHGSCPATF